MRLSSHTRIIVSIVLLCFFSGCFPGIKEDITKFTSLKKLKPRKYPLFSDSIDPAGLNTAIDKSIEYFKKVPFSREYQYGRDVFSAGHMINSLETFKTFLGREKDHKALNRFIKDNFLVYEAAGNDDRQVLFTGYFEPSYEGSLVRDDLYPYPVYSIPGDMLEIDLSLFSEKYKGERNLTARLDSANKKILPYYSREEINLIRDFQERSEPVVWLKSRVDRFFLEIQGSGRIVLENSDILRVHYAGSNGRAYKSIGRYLIDAGEIEKEAMSMQAIRRWLDENPDRVDEVLNHNESFVFFQTEEGGPYGSLGVEVTPLRSVATDSGLFPRGGLCFITSKLPDKDDPEFQENWEDAAFFALNQDTGGAIKGPARCDLFCGNGEYARYTAGHMNQHGKLYFLVLKP